MQWVNGLKRDDSGVLKLVVQDRGGERSLIKFEDLSPVDRSSNSQILDVDLSKLKQVDSREYLDGLGLGLEFANSQPVYELHLARDRILIPAQTIIYGLLGSALSLRKTLLHPMGMTSLKSAICDDSGTQLIKTPSHQQKTSATGKSLDVTLMWILCYPSASRAWGSVYRNALNGQLDLHLPSAKLRLRMDFRRHKSVKLATGLTVSEVLPLEAPHPFVRFDVTENLKLQKWTFDVLKARKKTASDPRLVGICNANGLSDFQWALIEPIFRQMPARTGKAANLRKYSWRQLVSAAVVLFSTQKAWLEFPEGKKFVWSVKRTLWILRQTGRWEEIVLLLVAHSKRPT